MDSEEHEGLAAIQAQLLTDRNKLIVELGLDGGLAQEQSTLAANAARKRGAKKKEKSTEAPTMARRSLRCVSGSLPGVPWPLLTPPLIFPLTPPPPCPPPASPACKTLAPRATRTQTAPRPPGSPTWPPQRRARTPLAT